MSEMRIARGKVSFNISLDFDASLLRRFPLNVRERYHRVFTICNNGMAIRMQT